VVTAMAAMRKRRMTMMRMMPCLIFQAKRPNMKRRAVGMMSSRMICMALVKGVGFS